MITNLRRFTAKLTAAILIIALSPLALQNPANASDYSSASALVKAEKSPAYRSVRNKYYMAAANAGFTVALWGTTIFCIADAVGLGNKANAIAAGISCNDAGRLYTCTLVGAPPPGGRVSRRQKASVNTGG